MAGTVVLYFRGTETTKEIARADGSTVELVTSTSNYQTRMEIGELVAAGTPTNFEEAMKYIDITQRAKNGEVFPVRWLAGTCYGDNIPTGSDLEWLKNLRVYRYSELTSSVPVKKEE